MVPALKHLQSKQMRHRVGEGVECTSRVKNVMAENGLLLLGWVYLGGDQEGKWVRRIGKGRRW